MITKPSTTYPLAFQRTPSATARAEAEREAILANPGFGTYFTDHMVTIDWTVDAGWDHARVIPYGPIELDPAAAVLHYAQEIFEGLKAYKHADGSIWTFRPEKNAERFQSSARRLALPELSVDDFIESLRQIIAIDGAWVPSAPETSLYIRPFMIATERFLGIRPAQEVQYCVIASPGSVYFHAGGKAISIWLSTNYSRAGRGGTGAAKCGGNYAASLLPQAEANENGCAQVLFLDAETGTCIDELGGMNVFLVYKDGTLATPRLNGAILEGVTRASVIQIARDRGHTVEERDITLDEWRSGVDSGDITEVFACGTAVGITAIGELKSEHFSVGSTDKPVGEITQMLRRELNDIQYGLIADERGWLTRLDA